MSIHSLTHTRTHLPQAYRNIWRYETAPHKMLSSAFAQFFQSCPYWFPPARPADPVSVPPRYEAFLNSSGTPSQHITIRSEEHTSELQSRFDLVCRLLL